MENSKNCKCNGSGNCHKNRCVSICLVSIVKDEEHVIERMLNNMNKFVDEFIIVDTGSTDNTKNLILDFFKNNKIKGKLYDRPWKNFGHNKSEALEIAESESDCDYLLFMDADNTIVGEPIFPHVMDADVYLLKQSYDTSNFFWRQQLFKNGLGWRYEGVLHEYPASDNSKIEARIEGDYYCKETHEGSRNKDLKKKYEKDVMVLLEGLKVAPNNARYMFYLGQSYECLAQFELAAKWYYACSQNSKWDEEIYYSLYKTGVSLFNVDKDGKFYLLNAWKFRPQRIESMYFLLMKYYDKNQFVEAYLTGKLIIDTPACNDTLFVEQDVHNWKLYDVMSLICYNVGFIDEGKIYFNKLKNIPESEKNRIEFNKQFFE